MGAFFSNIHIKKNERFDIGIFTEILRRDMKEKGFNELDDADDSEITMCIYCPEDSEWITVASDYFEFSDAEDTKEAAIPFSEKFGTDVIAAACMDSDYLMMNLINAGKGIDGWINCGYPYDEKYPRRTSMVPWKTLVSDYRKFKEAVQSDYVFAEEAFQSIAPLLKMNVNQCCLQPDDAQFLEDDGLIYLYFSFPEGENNVPPVLRLNRAGGTCSGMTVSVNSIGSCSEGLGVVFWGDFIENDEAVIEEASIISRASGDKHNITLEKRKIANGEYMLFWKDNDFVIPEGCDQSLPYSKLAELEFEKTICLFFSIKANSPKLLDVGISIIPLKNVNGSANWKFYMRDGTTNFYEKPIK